MIFPQIYFEYSLLFNSTFLYQNGVQYRFYILFEFLSF